MHSHKAVHTHFYSFLPGAERLQRRKSSDGLGKELSSLDQHQAQVKGNKSGRFTSKRAAGEELNEEHRCVSMCVCVYLRGLLILAVVFSLTVYDRVSTEYECVYDISISVSVSVWMRGIHVQSV